MDYMARAIEDIETRNVEALIECSQNGVSPNAFFAANRYCTNLSVSMEEDRDSNSVCKLSSIMACSMIVNRHRDEATIARTVQLLIQHRFDIRYEVKNVPNKYLTS